MKKTVSVLLLAVISLTFFSCEIRKFVPGKSFFEQTDVFVAGQDGIAEYRIPVLLTSNQGTLLAFCDARVDKPGDSPNNIDLVMKRSTDNGKTWGPLRVLLDAGEGGTVDSCGLVDRKTGTLWVFTVYCPVGIGTKNAKSGISGSTFMYWAIKSDDDGQTWSDPIDITAMTKKPEWRAGSPGPGKGLQLKNGRLIIPKYYRSTDDSSDSTSHIVFSDDHGKSWELGGEAQSQEKTNECQIVELSDGRLLLNMRGESGNFRKVARSSDKGLSWSKVTNDMTLIDSRCQASLLNFTDNTNYQKNRILFSNPASTKREKMTIRLSYDDGWTWPAERQLYAGPSAYSCLTILSDMTIGCLYERGQQGPYEKITFARVNLEWLTKGKDSLTPK